MGKDKRRRWPRRQRKAEAPVRSGDPGRSTDEILLGRLVAYASAGIPRLPLHVRDQIHAAVEAGEPWRIRFVERDGTEYACFWIGGEPVLDVALDVLDPDDLLGRRSAPAG
jgi:hypothetical protein